MIAIILDYTRKLWVWKPKIPTVSGFAFQRFSSCYSCHCYILFNAFTFRCCCCIARFSDPYCMLGIQPGCCSGTRTDQPSPLDASGCNEERQSLSFPRLARLDGAHRTTQEALQLPAEFQAQKKRVSFHQAVRPPVAT